MSPQNAKHRPFLRAVLPKDPAIIPYEDWLPANRDFLDAFCDWLHKTGYSLSTMKIYGVATRQVIGFLNKPYWKIEPDVDLPLAWEYLRNRPLAQSTRLDYRKGVEKLGEYLRLRCHTPRPEKAIRWDYYLGSLPDWLAAAVREYVDHCRRAWKPERRFDLSCDFLGVLTFSLRRMVAHQQLADLTGLTPALWLDYLDERLRAGKAPTTVNRELIDLQRFLRFHQELGVPICERMLLLKPIHTGPHLPRDLPPEQLRLLYEQILVDAQSSHAGRRRSGLLDRAWFLLMLHSGLRTCEVRFLTLADIDWEQRRIRITQSKGLKDRLVFLSTATLQALRAYLEVRGPQDILPAQVFTFRHQMLSVSYCSERLKTFGRRCGVKATAHQLRHSCATLLLNAGAPVLTVQTLLGHKWIDTTLGYARLYDGVVATDYYRAMHEVEHRLALPEDQRSQPPCIGELLAMVDALRQGTLNASQAELVQSLHTGLAALAERDNHMKDVKVQPPVDGPDFSP